MTFRERIEGNPLFWLLCALFSGFVTGVGAYEGILRVGQLEVTSRAELKELKRIAETPNNLSWTGLWETDTATYKNLRVQFSESNGEIHSTYRVPGQTSTLPEGEIHGKIIGTTIVGRWIEGHSDAERGGEIHLVLFDKGQSFLGSYTRDWEKGVNRHVWSGKKIE